MKQKNLVLVAVAVGCGLVAAFLTTQIPGKQAPVEQFDVPVALVDLPIGKKITKEELDQVVELKKFNKDAVPPAYVTKEELVDKRLTRNIPKGNFFNPTDVTTQSAIAPPPGMQWVSFRGDTESLVAGFAGPGSRVDVFAAVRKRNSEQQTIFTLFSDMLVLAIGAQHVPGEQTGPSRDLSNISLAMAPEQAKLLHAALNRGAALRLVLRNDQNPAHNPPEPAEKVWAILNEEKSESAPAKPAVEMVKVPIAGENLKAGTELTAEVLAKFNVVELPAANAPKNVITDLREHAGRFLQKDVSEGEWLSRKSVGDKPLSEVAPAPARVVEPPAPKVETKPEEPKKVEPKPEEPADEEGEPEYYDTTVTTPEGVKTFRYQKTKSGEWVPVGEVKPNSPKPKRKESKDEGRVFE